MAEAGPGKCPALPPAQAAPVAPPAPRDVSISSMPSWQRARRYHLVQLAQRARLDRVVDLGWERRRPYRRAWPWRSCSAARTARASRPPSTRTTKVLASAGDASASRQRACSSASPGAPCIVSSTSTTPPAQAPAEAMAGAHSARVVHDRASVKLAARSTRGIAVLEPRAPCCGAGAAAAAAAAARRLLPRLLPRLLLLLLPRRRLRRLLRRL